MLPRFAWHPLGSQNGLLMRDGNPTLSLICYKDPEDLKPLVKIPLDGARIVVEGGSMTEEGYLASPLPPFVSPCGSREDHAADEGSEDRALARVL